MSPVATSKYKKPHKIIGVVMEAEDRLVVRNKRTGTIYHVRVVYSKNLSKKLVIKNALYQRKLYLDLPLKQLQAL